MFYDLFIRLLLSLLCLVNLKEATVFVANEQNFDKLIGQFELTLIKFSAEWCRFSQMLSPIFDQASENITDLTKLGKAALITIDCEASQAVCSKERINKYPTVKVTRYGKILSQEYRSQRTPEAIIEFINEHLNYKHPLVDGNLKKPEEFLQTFEIKRNSIIALVNKLDAAVQLVDVFKRVSHVKRDKCDFHLIHNLETPLNRIIFRDYLLNTTKDFPLNDQLEFNALHDWVSDQSTPVVRELTFANAEEITEEHLPLLLLFYHPDNRTIVSQFMEFVKNHMMHQRSAVNFLVADGFQFTHPLSHLGKSTSDLPLICLDSFAHMYLFPKDIHLAFSGDNLNQFIEDFKSGKLHLEYHYGTATDAPTTAAEDVGDKSPTTPPESVFRRLAPSRMRYTILHDEF